MEAACGAVHGTADHALTTSYIVFLATIISCYLVLSVSLTISVKWLESYYDDGLFNYPLLITGTVFVVEYCALLLFRCSPGCDRYVGTFPRLDKTLMQRLVVPTGLLVAAHYACDNMAVSKMSVSLETMLTSSSTLFVMSFSLLLGLETPSSLTWMVVLVVTSGLVLVCVESVGDNLDVAGVVYALLGASSLGMRWPLTQILLQVVKVQEFNLMFNYLPFAIALMAVGIALTEATSLFTSGMTAGEAGFACLVMILIGAWCLVLYYLELVACRLTSAVTQQLVSAIKQVVQICVSVWVYNEHLRNTEMYGFALILVGIFIYTLQRYLEIRSAGGIRLYNQLHRDRMNKRLKQLGLLDGIRLPTEPSVDSDSDQGPLEHEGLLRQHSDLSYGDCGSYQNGTMATL